MDPLPTLGVRPCLHIFIFGEGPDCYQRQERWYALRSCWFSDLDTAYMWSSAQFLETMLKYIGCWAQSFFLYAPFRGNKWLLPCQPAKLFLFCFLVRPQVFPHVAMYHLVLPFRGLLFLRMSEEGEKKQKQKDKLRRGPSFCLLLLDIQPPDGKPRDCLLQIVCRDGKTISLCAESTDDCL